MNYQLGYLGVLLSATILVGCGGSPGTSSDTSAVVGPTQGNPPADGGTTPANSPPVTPTVNTGLSKYEGIWYRDCVDHVRLKMTATATSSDTFSVSRNEEHFANANCTGAIVANGNYGVPDETVQYTAPLENVSVQLLTGATIVTNVDPGSSVSAIARFIFTDSDGSVIPSVFVLGKTTAVIKYAEGDVAISRAPLSGQSTSGALLLWNGELLSLVPIENSAASFRVNQRYIRFGD